MFLQHGILHGSCGCVLPVFAQTGHFADLIITLRIPTGSYRLVSSVPEKWLLCWCDRGLGATKSDIGAKHGLSPQKCTRMIANPRQCDRSKCKAVKSKIRARWADVAFYDKNWCLLETTYDRDKLGSGDIRCPRHQLRRKIHNCFNSAFVIKQRPTRTGVQIAHQLASKPNRIEYRSTEPAHCISFGCLRSRPIGERH